MKNIKKGLPPSPLSSKFLYSFEVKCEGGEGGLINEDVFHLISDPQYLVKHEIF